MTFDIKEWVKKNVCVSFGVTTAITPEDLIEFMEDKIIISNVEYDYLRTLENAKKSVAKLPSFILDESYDEDDE